MNKESVMELSQDRKEVLKRIEEYERLGYFDRDCVCVGVADCEGGCYA